MGKSKPPMNVDTAPFWHFIVAAIVTVVILLIAIIVGATGPTAKEMTEHYTYDCADHTHVWNDTQCTGKQLGTAGVAYSVSTHALISTNRFWGVKVVPYNKNVAGHSKHNKNAMMSIEIIANVSYRNDLRSAWHREVTNRYHKVSVECPTTIKGDLKVESGKCKGFTLAYERGVSHKYHQVSFEMRVNEETSLALGDVGAHVYFGTTSYSNLEMGVNIFYLIVSLVVFLVFAWMLRDLIFRGWTFEQGCTLFLSLAVVIYNNPFFSLEYLLPGVFFVVFDSVVKSAFLALVLLFWLLAFDKARVGEESFRLFEKTHVPKLVAVAACFILAAITFSWSAIREKIDPIFGSPFSSPGVVTFYVFTVIVLALVFVWIIIFGIMAVPTATASQKSFTRFCFIIVSSSVVAISIIVGAFCGDFGTNNTNCKLCYWCA